MPKDFLKAMTYLIISTVLAVGLSSNADALKSKGGQQNKGSEGNEIKIHSSVNLFSYVAQVFVTHQFFWIFDINLNSESEDVVPFTLSSIADSFYRILIPRIISPNAP